LVTQQLFGVAGIQPEGAGGDVMVDCFTLFWSMVYWKPAIAPFPVAVRRKVVAVAVQEKSKFWLLAVSVLAGHAEGNTVGALGLGR
jgi:hypothetical protein